MNLESMGSQTGVIGLGGSFAPPTHYEILNVDKSATRFAIREAYLRLKNLYSNGGDGLYGVAGADDLARHIQELDAAFDVLNDDARRACYDDKLAGIKSAQETCDWTNEGSAWNAPLIAPTNDVIQTSRSLLKVTKTQANGVNRQDLQVKLLGIMDEGDVGDGSILVALRQAVGVGQPEIQERTKISFDYIRSMETNQFDRLPKVVYVRGFMRSYLRYLNVPNPEKIVSAYVARLEAWQAGQK
jgi:hypothetical protein